MNVSLVVEVVRHDAHKPVDEGQNQQRPEAKRVTAPTTHTTACNHSIDGTRSQSEVHNILVAEVNMVWASSAGCSRVKPSAAASDGSMRCRAMVRTRR